MIINENVGMCCMGMGGMKMGRLRMDVGIRYGYGIWNIIWFKNVLLFNNKCINYSVVFIFYSYSNNLI